MCAVLGFELLFLVRLRGASSLAEAAPWMNPIPKLPGIAGGSILTILLSGIYLVRESSHFHEAWPRIAVAAVFLMAPLGAFTGRRMNAVRKAPTIEKLQDAMLKVSLAIRIATFFGIFLIVSAKPGTWESVALLAACLALGLLSSTLPWRQENAGLRKSSTIS